MKEIAKSPSKKEKEKKEAENAGAEGRGDKFSPSGKTKTNGVKEAEI